MHFFLTIIACLLLIKSILFYVKEQIQYILLEEITMSKKPFICGDELSYFYEQCALNAFIVK